MAVQLETIAIERNRYGDRPTANLSLDHHKAITLPGRTGRLTVRSSTAGTANAADGFIDPVDDSGVKLPLKRQKAVELVVWNG